MIAHAALAGFHDVVNLSPHLVANAVFHDDVLADEHGIELEQLDAIEDLSFLRIVGIHVREIVTIRHVSCVHQRRFVELGHPTQCVQLVLGAMTVGFMKNCRGEKDWVVMLPRKRLVRGVALREFVRCHREPVDRTG